MSGSRDNGLCKFQ